MTEGQTTHGEDFTDVAVDLSKLTSAKKNNKKFIKSTVTVHDRTQIEAVFDYYLLKTADALAHLNYRVEAFFFFPPQLALTSATYPKEKFYADVRPLIRFREPRLGFKKMRGLKTGSDSPLVFLKNQVSALQRGIPPAEEHIAVDEIRIFACSLVGNFLKNIDRWRRRFDRLRATGAPAPEVLEEYFTKMSRLLGKMHDTLLEYRQIATELTTLAGDGLKSVRTELGLIDEYCYYRLRDGVSFLLQIADGFRTLTNVPAVAQFDESVRELLAFHDMHAAKVGYMLISRDSPETIKEQYLRRRGELKRRVWGVLFLDLRTEQLFAFRQQIGPMIAAGFASIWAVIAQFTIINKTSNDRAFDVLGLSGMFFVFVATLAYVVKDRIKEIGRSYLRRGLFGRLPDHSERIHYAPRRVDPRPVGRLTEMTRFASLQSLPAEVSRIRAAHELFDTPVQEDDDTVLHYTKEVALNRSIKILGRYPLRAVHDIVRFNIDSFLPKLGEPMRALNVIDEDLRVHAVGFPKVYFVDLALRYSRVGKKAKGKSKDKEKDEAVDYFRLVLDKTGLLRVERLT